MVLQSRGRNAQIPIKSADQSPRGFLRSFKVHGEACECAGRKYGIKRAAIETKTKIKECIFKGSGADEKVSAPESADPNDLDTSEASENR